LKNGLEDTFGLALFAERVVGDEILIAY
jgi:hypothetical protein